MYERSAVVLERYFTESFYLNEKDKLKTNFENYRKLIEVLEKYQEVSEAEDKIIKECEDIASQIKQIQKGQGSLYRKTIKLQEDRNSLFENIDESALELGKQLDKIEKEIDKNNAKMRPIDQEFIDTIGRFNEKSDIRSECGKKRRNIEKEYRNILEKTMKNINNIDAIEVTEIIENIKLEDNSVNIELKDIMVKNGEKEKEPFDLKVIEKSILFGKNIYKQEGNILTEIYEKTNSLLKEINNNAVKIKKYKKLSKDSKNILEFINVEKEYLAQFLDNERLSIGLGKKEHKKLMKEACEDFDKDTNQINNLYELLVAETTKDIDNKNYKELYRADYLADLQKKENEFEKKLRKLNLVGKILNPINWRIVSIEKIYLVFDEIVTNEYQRDLSSYKIENMFKAEEDDLFNIDEHEYDETTIEENPKSMRVKKTNKEDTKKIEEEIEISHDIMKYYDDLDEEPEQEESQNDEENYDDDDFEDNFYKTFYNDDDFYDDEENDEEGVYEDLETILKNRRKRANRARIMKTRSTKKKGFFGIGGKKW